LKARRKLTAPGAGVNRLKSQNRERLAGFFAKHT
jgi:hypothetical protein